jgi:hypothetical protein
MGYKFGKKAKEKEWVGFTYSDHMTMANAV